MKPYTGIAAHALPDPKSPDFTARLRDMLTTIDVWARDATFGFGRLEQGQKPSGSGEVIVTGGVTDHGALTGLGDDDHSQYLLLAGRSGGMTLGVVDNNAVLTTSIGGSVTTPHILDCLATSSFGSNYVIRIRQSSTNKLLMDWTGRVAIGGNGQAGFGTTGAVLTIGALSSASTHIDMWADAAQGVDIVKSRDSSLNVLAGLTKDHYWYARRFLLSGSTSGQITLSAGATPTAHTLTLPSANASGVLKNDGAGALSWSTDLVLNTLSVGSGGFVLDSTGQLVDVLSFLSSGGGYGNIDFSGVTSAGIALTCPNASGEILIANSTVTIQNKTLQTNCKIRCSASGVMFQDSSSTTKQMRLDLSGITAGQTRALACLDVGGTVPLVGNDPPAVASGALGKVDLTAQTANIATTNLSSTPPAGLYLVEVYLACTTADVTAGTLAVTIGWTDVVGATSSTPITGFALTATGRTSGRQIVQLSSGDITYAVAVTGAYGTSQYAVYVRVIALG